MDNDDGDLLLHAARQLSALRLDSAFADLTRAVTELLGCQVGLLGRYVEVDGVPSVETLACYADGAFVPNTTYPLHGTPCETVVGNEFQFYPRDVGMLFPEVLDADARIESYAAYPLFDRNRAPLGILTVMSFAPLGARARVETLLRMFAERAVAELERDAAAVALRRSEEQYRAIFNASLDGLVLLRTDGTIVDVNRAVEHQSGFSRDELCGHNVLDVLAGNRREAGEAFLRTVLENGYAQTTDRLQRKDGSSYLMEPRAVLMDYRGETHILTTVRDISEDVARDHALQDSESLLRATVEAGLDCIIVMDSQGLVMEFNPAAERTFGYSRNDVIGRRLSELVIPDRFRAAHDSGLQRFLETGSGPFLDRRVEVTAMRADGQELPVELTIGVARSRSGTLFIGYLRDITQRRDAERQRQALEAQLRQAQKMEALGHLTGGVAHDFNNILTSVLGYVEMATDMVADSDDDRLSRYLMRARLSGERARDLVQQMLTFSRGQKGEPRPVRLPRVVEEGMYLLEATMPATLELKTAFESDLPPVELDPVHAEQVLVNLCINARDAMRGAGSLEVRVRHATHDDQRCSSCHQSFGGEFVALSVRDDGPGLDALLIERIFEPFFSTKEAGKGSGMGLSSVHGIVHEYGGHIVVDSTPGQGATFHVLFPARRRDAADEAAVRGGRNETAGGRLQGRVLVVDDNLVVAEFLDELLSGWGLHVVPFANGNAALQNFRTAPHDYDLVITDQTMPHITGLELAREMLALRADLPVVLFTGYSETVNEHIAREAGIRALLGKPLDIPAFRSLLGDLLAPAT